MMMMMLISRHPFEQPTLSLMSSHQFTSHGYRTWGAFQQDLGETELACFPRGLLLSFQLAYLLLSNPVILFLLFSFYCKSYAIFEYRRTITFVAEGGVSPSAVLYTTLV